MLSYPRISGALETSGYCTTSQYHSVHHCIIVCFTHTIEDGGASEECVNEAKLVLVTFRRVDA